MDTGPWSIRRAARDVVGRTATATAALKDGPSQQRGHRVTMMDFGQFIINFAFNMECFVK